jgi:hypothetical protein
MAVKENDLARGKIIKYPLSFLKIKPSFLFVVNKNVHKDTSIVFDAKKIP